MSRSGKVGAGSSASSSSSVITGAGAGADGGCLERVSAGWHAKEGGRAGTALAGTCTCLLGTGGECFGTPTSPTSQTSKELAGPATVASLSSSKAWEQGFHGVEKSVMELLLASPPSSLVVVLGPLIFLVVKALVRKPPY